MRDTIRLFDLRLEDSLKKRVAPFGFSKGYYPAYALDQDA